MAAEENTGDQLKRSTALRLQQLKGQLFEVALVAATLVGIVSLLALFAQIANDAFQPRTASARGISSTSARSSHRQPRSPCMPAGDRRCGRRTPRRSRRCLAGSS
jgi:hypothetical protein